MLDSGVFANSSSSLEVADGRTLDCNTEDTFIETSNGVPLPAEPHSFSDSKLTTTLLSGPKLVYEHNYDVVLSKQHSAFMQPSSLHVLSVTPITCTYSIHGG